MNFAGEKPSEVVDTLLKYQKRGLLDTLKPKLNTANFKERIILSLTT